MGNYESFLKTRGAAESDETKEEKEAANLDATNPSEASQANDDTQNLMGPDGDLEQNEGSDEDPSTPAADQSKANAKNNR